MNYYKKECLSTPLQTGAGIKFDWVACFRDTGILATENPEAIAALDRCVANRKGGLSVISEAEFEEIKKNPRQPSSLRQIKPTIDPTGRMLANQVFGVARPAVSKAVAAVAAVKPNTELASLADDGPPTRKSILAAQQQQPETVAPSPQPPARKRGRPPKQKTVSQPDTHDSEHQVR